MNKTEKRVLSDLYDEATAPGRDLARRLATGDRSLDVADIMMLRNFAEQNPHAALGCIEQLIRIAEYSGEALRAVPKLAVASGLEAETITMLSHYHSNIVDDSTQAAAEIAISSRKETVASLALAHIKEKHRLVYAAAAANIGLSHPTLAPMVLSMLIEEMRDADKDFMEGTTRKSLARVSLKNVIDFIRINADRYPNELGEGGIGKLKAGLQDARTVIPDFGDSIDAILKYIAKAEAAAPKPGGPEAPGL